MNDRADRERARGLALEYDLDAPPEKVWRAISIPAFRDRWLPGGDLAEAEPVATEPGVEIRYRMRDGAPPFFDSVVTFRLRPGAAGGTILRVVHELAEARPAQAPPANRNGPVLMRAA
jgi:uncharacterized protein YndB with AHSA1/START domain